MASALLRAHVGPVYVRLVEKRDCGLAKQRGASHANSCGQRCIDFGITAHPDDVVLEGERDQSAARPDTNNPDRRV